MWQKSDDDDVQLQLKTVAKTGWVVGGKITRANYARQIHKRAKNIHILNAYNEYSLGELYHWSWHSVIINRRRERLPAPLPDSQPHLSLATLLRVQRLSIRINQSNR